MCQKGKTRHPLISLPNRSFGMWRYIVTSLTSDWSFNTSQNENIKHYEQQKLLLVSLA